MALKPLYESMKVTCTQEWSTYDDAQMHEQERFVILLRDLCNGIEQPTQTFGRPRLPLSDIVFAVAYKVYSTMSGRRFHDLTSEKQKQKNWLLNSLLLPVMLAIWKIPIDPTSENPD